ncbi:MAG: protein kinase [Holophagales bacterium]|nr:protein kinase [Holophagales bacterium]
MQKGLWKRVEPILDRALELPEAEREAFLDRACAGEPELRAELASLMEECAGVDGFLDPESPELLRVRADSLDGTGPDDDPDKDLIGRRLGNYRLVEVLGRGGMGTVYLGRRADRLFEQEVAIKVADRLRLGPGGPLRFPEERFHYERRILAALDHPNIARLFDGGMTGDGLPYLVMERVNGAPIDEHCRRGALDTDARIRLLIEACGAIGHAHRRRVVHLDLKPSNILVTSEGAVKLLDFGVAELLSSDPSSGPAPGLEVHHEPGTPGGKTPSSEPSAEPTPAGSTPGSAGVTPSFAAPERLRGDTPTPASDVYSMAVVAHLLLVGRLPFERRSHEGRPEFVERILREEVPPPEIDPDLRQILRKALAKDPDARYRSVDDLADDLHRFLEARPVAARPATPGYLLRKALSRHRFAALAGVGVGLLVFLLAAGWWRDSQQAEERVRIARLFGGEAERIEGFLRYAYALPEHDVRRETALSVERMGRIEEQMRELGPLAEGSGHLALGRGYLGLRRAERARLHLEAAWAAGERSSEAAYLLGRALGELYGRERKRALRARDPRLRELRLQELEIRYRDRAVSLLERARGASGERVSAPVLAGLIALYDGDFALAVEHGREAAAATPWLPDGPRLEGEALRSQGEEAMARTDYTEASEAFEGALRALGRATHLAPSDPSLAQEACTVHVARAGMASLRKQDLSGPFGDGLEACERSRRLHPDRVAPRLELATLYLASIQDPSLPLEEREDRLRHTLGLLHGFGAEGRGEEAAGETPSLLAASTEDTDAALAESHETEALRLLGTAHLTMAVYLDRIQGRDPRPALEDAAAAYRQTVRVDPSLLAARVNLGTSLALTAEENLARGSDPIPLFEAAVINFHQALEQAPEHGALLHNLSTLLYRLGIYRSSLGMDAIADFEAAVAHNTRTLEAAPGLPAALNLKGAALEALAILAWRRGEEPAEHFDRAEEALWVTLEAAPAYHMARMNLASVRLARARTRAADTEEPRELALTALEDLDLAAELHRVPDPMILANRAETHLFLGRLAHARGDDPRPDLDAARRSVDDGLAVDPREPLLLLRQAELRLLEARTVEGGPSCPRGAVAAVESLLAFQERHAPARAIGARAHLWCAAVAEGGAARTRHLDEARLLLDPVPEGPGAPEAVPLLRRLLTGAGLSAPSDSDLDLEEAEAHALARALGQGSGAG